MEGLRLCHLASVLTLSVISERESRLVGGTPRDSRRRFNARKSEQRRGVKTVSRKTIGVDMRQDWGPHGASHSRHSDVIPGVQRGEALRRKAGRRTLKRGKPGFKLNQNAAPWRRSVGVTRELQGVPGPQPGAGSDWMARARTVSHKCTHSCEYICSLINQIQIRLWDKKHLGTGFNEFERH
jgi:hypothetical protein